MLGLCSQCDASHGKCRAEEGGVLTQILTSSLWMLGGEETGRWGAVAGRKTIEEETAVVQVCALCGWSREVPVR